MIELLSGSQVFLAVFLGATGLFIGSFLNVVIHRLPIMLQREWRNTATEILTDNGCSVSCPTADTLPEKYNLMVPRSACPGCETPIRPWQNIPVISYLLLRGKCAKCGIRISPRYPLVELLTGMAFAVVAWHFGWGWPLVFALVFTTLLVAATFIDLDHKLLPDTLTLPLLWFGLVAGIGGQFTDLQSAVVGALAGYLILWSIYWLFKLLTGKEGMGHGDFKLLAALGAFVGWQLLPVIIVLSSLVGAILGSLVMVAQKKGRNFKIPFGPFLAIAGWITLLWGRSIVDAYLNFSGI